MRFGLFGGARTDPGEQASDSRIYTDYIDYICEAEQLGYHSVFLVEHHFAGFGQVSATLNFLTYLAAKTTTMRLGPAVLVLPWHNPALLAEQAATLDLLSNGRFDFGVGKGYRWGEFHGFRIPMQEAEGWRGVLPPRGNVGGVGRCPPRGGPEKTPPPPLGGGGGAPPPPPPPPP